MFCQNCCGKTRADIEVCFACWKHGSSKVGNAVMTDSSTIATTNAYCSTSACSRRKHGTCCFQAPLFFCCRWWGRTAHPHHRGGMDGRRWRCAGQSWGLGEAVVLKKKQYILSYHVQRSMANSSLHNPLTLVTCDHPRFIFVLFCCGFTQSLSPSTFQFLYIAFPSCHASMSRRVCEQTNKGFSLNLFVLNIHLTISFGVSPIAGYHTHRVAHDWKKSTPNWRSPTSSLLGSCDTHPCLSVKKKFTVLLNCAPTPLLGSAAVAVAIK